MVFHRMINACHKHLLKMKNAVRGEYFPLQFNSLYIRVLCLRERKASDIVFKCLNLKAKRIQCFSLLLLLRCKSMNTFMC